MRPLAVWTTMGNAENFEICRIHARRTYISYQIELLLLWIFVTV